LYIALFFAEIPFLVKLDIPSTTLTFTIMECPLTRSFICLYVFFNCFEKSCNHVSALNSHTPEEKSQFNKKKENYKI